MSTTRRGRGRPPREAETPQETEEQRLAREAAEAEAREQDAADDDQDDGDDEGDQDDGDDEGEREAGDGEGDPESDLASISRTNYDDLQPGQPEAAFLDEASGDGLAIGSVLTTRQIAGIDPEDPARHVEQASNRAPLQNAQTDHERYNGLDAVSGTANTGITEQHNHSAPGALGASDMSGRRPMADPLANSGSEVQRVMAALRRASTDAMQAGKRGHGYLSLRDLNVNKAVLDALVAGKYVTQEERPGGSFNPDTGTVYRVADHVEPEPRK